ncbi:hypothetical protein EV356DRAFT_347481 [Viridothelium virens]|uniref:Uncharacterized protein n=1 Tax=Viridothelium virens TaxID=1048519 RepID=A0A6A6GWX2_VIRVR|nr:hypothetical protein EV356DRAFT_347481 [Viridothelium virens]
MSIDSSPMESNNVEKTVIPESSTQHNLGHPQRTRSWGRRRNSQVVVLVTSNESLYLVNEESLDPFKDNLSASYPLDTKSRRLCLGWTR